MALISIRPEERLEVTSKFNTWRDRIMNILEQCDMDGYISNVVEEITTNVGCTAFENNQTKEKRIIYDYVKDCISI